MVKEYDLGFIVSKITKSYNQNYIHDFLPSFLPQSKNLWSDITKGGISDQLRRPPCFTGLHLILNKYGLDIGMTQDSIYIVNEKFLYMFKNLFFKYVPINFCEYHLSRRKYKKNKRRV